MKLSRLIAIIIGLSLILITAGCTDSIDTPSETAPAEETPVAEQPTEPSTTAPTTEESETTSFTESSVYVTDLNLQEEWVQISNIGSSPVSLAGWKIEDEGSKHTYTFPSYTLSAGSTVTVFTGKGTDSEIELYWQLDDPILNYDDTVYLYDDSGKLVSKRASKSLLTGLKKALQCCL